MDRVIEYLTRIDPLDAQKAKKRFVDERGKEREGKRRRGEGGWGGKGWCVGVMVVSFLGGKEFRREGGKEGRMKEE